MTVSHKAILSLLISVVLFAAITVLAFMGFFDLVETRLYNPSLTRSLEREVGQDGELIQDFFEELQKRFSLTLENTAVKHSFLINQSPEDIAERSRLYGLLHESLGGLQSVRFVDAGGSRIHFSSYEPDLLRQDNGVTAYYNYNEERGDLPFDKVAVPEGEDPKITLDAEGDRIVFSFPFSDSFEVYRGTALFSLSPRALTERLVSRGRISLGDGVSILADPPGIVSGLSGQGKAELGSAVASVWREGILTLTALDSADSAASMALISTRTGQGIFVGRLVDESLFSFPLAMKLILLGSLFLTLFLTIFLLFNVRQDSMTVVQNRIKRLQVSLIEEYYNHKNEIDWLHWRRELEQRREDVRTELKRGIREKTGKDSDINSLIDKSWDELLAIIGGRQERLTSNIDEEKLRRVLSRLLSAPASPVPAVQAVASQSAEAVEELAEAEPVEAVEELAEAEPAEEVEELAEAEPVEAVEELAEAESAEEVEELAEAEPAEAVEELAEAESAEEVEDLAEAEEVEELAEAEPAEELEELAEAEPVETVEELAEAESVGIGVSDADFEELEELEELEEEPAASYEDKGPAVPKENIDDLASEIEFGFSGKDEETVEEIQDLEVVSPLAMMFSGPDSKGLKSLAGGLEEVGDTTSLMYRPFSGKETINPELLDESIIEERDGVNYINEKILKPSEETEKKLDMDFKNLIDSVLKK